MLAHRLQRCPNSEPTLGQRLIIAGLKKIFQHSTASPAHFLSIHNHDDNHLNIHKEENHPICNTRRKSLKKSFIYLQIQVVIRDFLK